MYVHVLATLYSAVKRFVARWQAEPLVLDTETKEFRCDKKRRRILDKR